MEIIYVLLIAISLNHYFFFKKIIKNYFKTNLILVSKSR